MKNNFILINFLNSIILMLIQVIMSLYFSFIFSNSINIFTLLTGIFLFSMSIPSLISFKKEYYHYLKYISIAINFLCLILIANFIYSLYFYNILFAIFTSFMLGFCSGFELPFFINSELKKNIIISDYLGTFLGTILFPLFLYPFLGTILSLILIMIVYNSYHFILIKNKLYLLKLIIYIAILVAYFQKYL